MLNTLQRKMDTIVRKDALNLFRKSKRMDSCQTSNGREDRDKKESNSRGAKRSKASGSRILALVSG
jgi:hypothetical protein